MHAGRLDRKITIEFPDNNVNSFGEDSITYVPLGEVWAQVKPLSGNEAYSADQRFAEATHEFTIWYRKDLTPTYRIVYQGMEFDILAIIELGRREGLKIVAQARAEDRNP